MSAPSDKELNEAQNNITPSEGIRQTGERIPTQRDQRTIEDEQRDYITLSENDIRAQKRSSTKQDARTVKDEQRDYITLTDGFVKSNKTSAGKRSRRSSRSSHHRSHTGDGSASEGIRQTGDLIHTQRDERSVEDDAMDYVFLKPKRSRSKHNGTHGTIRRKHHHHHHHRRKKWKKVLFGVGIGLLALVLIATAVLTVMVFRGQGELFTDEYRVIAPEGVAVEDNGRTVEYNGHTYKLNEQITNILFIGVDKNELNEKGAYGSEGQADVLVLMAYDVKNRKVSLINIPRDLMTDVPVYTTNGVYASTKRQQICLAYAYGDGKEKSCNYTVDAVTRLFYNMVIKTYYALDIDGISALNDSIGGVNVVSPETIGEFVNGGSYHLQGKQAEDFVRLRSQNNLDANLKRNERQKVYANAFMGDMFAAIKKDISVPMEVFKVSEPYSVTNMSASRVSYFAKDFALGGTPETQILNVDGTLKRNGEHAEYELKEKEFYELFLSVYYEKID